MRPTYENKNDLEREAKAKTVLERYFCPRNIVKLHKSFIIDFAVLDKKEIIAVCEFKTANYSIHTYPTFMMSLNKWNKGVEYFNNHKTSFYILAKYTEGYYIHKYNLVYDYWVELGGRKDRSDPMDIEPIIRIRTGNFKLIGEA